MYRRYFRGYAKRPFDTITNQPIDMPSEEFMAKLGVQLPGKATLSMPNAGDIGKITGGSDKVMGALGKAGGVAGGLMSGAEAVDNFKNGEYVDGALNAAKTIATFVPGGQPVALAIQGAQTVKDMFGNGGNSQVLNETMGKRQQALQKTKQFAQNAVNNSNTQGTMTGGASNVFNGNVQPNPIQDPISLYEESLRQQGFDDNVVNGIRQGLNSGIKEADQWIKQYNNGVGRENPINIPKTKEEIAAARAGNFNTPIQTGGVASETTEDNVKQGILDKFIDGITDLSKGYNENKNTAFNPENLQRDKNKGVMNKIGEFAGTMSRVAKNPLVYGALAGGIASAMGNPFALGIGAKYAQERAMSDVYRDVLAKYGINIPETVLGNVTNKDMDAFSAMKNAEALNNYRLGILDNKDKQIEINQKNADSRAIQADAAKTKADKYNGGGKGSASITAEPSGQYVIGETPDGRQVKVPIERVKEFKSNGGKIVG